MNTNLTLFSIVLLSVCILFLFFQYMKLSTTYYREIKAVKKDLLDLSNMVGASQEVHIDNSVRESAEEPRVNEELNNDNNDNYENLKNNYDTFRRDNEKYPNLSDDLKQEIERLENTESENETKNIKVTENNISVASVNKLESDEVESNEELESNDEVESNEELELDNNNIKLETEQDDLFVYLNNSKKNINDLVVKELQGICKHYSLTIKGKKTDLVTRIIEYNSSTNKLDLFENTTHNSELNK
jgi:hypothetical protein